MTSSAPFGQRWSKKRGSCATTGPSRNGRRKKCHAPAQPHAAHRPIGGAAKQASKQAGRQADLNLQSEVLTRVWVSVLDGTDQPNAEVSGRLTTTSFMTKVEVMRCIPGKAVSFSS